MDKVGSSNFANQSYDPDTCEASDQKPPVPTGSCPDGSVSYDGGVCAVSGLKGPPTAAQRYIANFTAGTEAATGPSKQESNAIQQAQGELKHVLTDATQAALENLRWTIEHSGLESGQKIDYAAKLPNGCKLEVSIAASVEMNAQGKPELTFEASGSVEGKFGVASAKIDLGYSRSANGDESFSVGACVFAGIDQEISGLAKVESKAGLCATLQDAPDALPTFELDAVVKAGVNLDLMGAWSWGHELLESKTALSKETLSSDFIR